jgi:hypothetical protein
MTRDVVVIVDQELSEHDASEVTALQLARRGPVDYHLLIAARSAGNRRQGVSLLGVPPGDTFGSDVVAHQAGVPAPGERERAPDLGRIIEHSARRLRSQGRNVTVAITHDDWMTGARALVKTTGSEEVVIVADQDHYSRFALPEWQRNARTYLEVPHVHAVEHVG